MQRAVTRKEMAQGVERGARLPESSRLAARKPPKRAWVDHDATWAAFSKLERRKRMRRG
jgi:hypothetical protein